MNFIGQAVEFATDKYFQQKKESTQVEHITLCPLAYNLIAFCAYISDYE